jgi:hypothetical protein
MAVVMDTRALRGFNSMRTPSTMHPSTAPPSVKRCCTICNAVLPSGNHTDTCCCHTFGEVDIPEWAIGMVIHDDRPLTVDTLACLLTGEPKKYDGRHGAPAVKRKLRTLYATGDYTVSDLARLFGLDPETVRRYLEIVKSHKRKEPTTQKTALADGLRNELAS